MCRICYLFVTCFFFVVSVSGECAISDIHALYPDTLMGELYAFSDAGEAGKDAVWDFRNLTAPQAAERCISLVLPDDSTRICIHEHHARTYYARSGDTLFCTGYENALTRMHYTLCEPLLLFPFHYGDSLSGDFAGMGEYCHQLPFTASGKTCTTADGIGRLLLPDAEMKDILRVHRCREWTEISGNVTNMQEDVWQWYAARCPHPIMEALRLVQRTEETDSVLYSSVSVFRSVADEEDYLLQEEETEDKSSECLLSDVSFLPNPVQTMLQISYRLACDAEVYVSVHYGGGVCMYSTQRVRETAGQHSQQVDMSAFPTGNYVLYIHADAEVLSETVIKL